jgi:hypothetical protein
MDMITSYTFGQLFARRDMCHHTTQLRFKSTAPTIAFEIKQIVLVFEGDGGLFQDTPPKSASTRIGRRLVG